MSTGAATRVDAGGGQCDSPARRRSGTLLLAPAVF